ncbi:DUF3857 domain-containing protein [Flavobacterium selenitireducens]|uniref:DUF3857 domain-containing protein n=1 Tax=Flavobacterium selenitireducens TaxID=2722704 RepID=UPI00168BE375|nr:DUF3857 domain-containing protein [Flavobacterium selenitireducens]MBD3583212.1 DUF3857 domain-containing protein [Flavobacterium selenitireducens]
MKRAIFIIVFLFCGFVSEAQKMQLGKVTVAELGQKTHQIDTSAAAAVLFSKAKTTFKIDREHHFKAVHEYNVKIKIYKKEGLGQANQEIAYYIGYKQLKPEQLRVEDAATYNLVGGQVKRTKVSSSEVFKEKVNESWKTATVVFPDVKIGSIIEFKYTVTSENIHAFPNFRFQRSIPVDYAEYVSEIPVNYQYKILTNGLFPIQSKVDTKSGSQSFENKYGQTNSLQYTLKVVTLSASELPALKSEDYVDNVDNYRASVDHELELIQFPDAPVRNFSQTWESLTQTIYKDEDFGAQIKKAEYFMDPLKRALAGTEPKAERMKKVFSLVQDRMSWNNRNGFYTADGVEKAWLNQTGNVAEINLMLVAMLNMAGVETYPVLISTIDHGVPAFPNQTSFNYVVACAIVDGRKVLMDASNKYTTPGIVPAKILNWSGRLVRQDGSSEEMSLTKPELSRRSYSLMGEVRPDGTVQGKTRVQMSELAGFEFRERFSGTNKESYAERLEQLYDNIEIDNYAVANENRSTDPVVETFDFTTAKHSEVIGGKLYIDPMLFFSMHANPFTTEERLMPVFFGYPRQSRYIIILKIPDGFAVESLPESVNITTGENVVSFRLACQTAGNSITISATYETGQMLVGSGFYPSIKGFFGEMVAKEKQKIVLKKA